MTLDDPSPPAAAPEPAQTANFPAPASERGNWLLAGALAMLGAAALVLALSLGGHSAPPRQAAAAPPRVPLPTTTPVPSPAQSASVLAGAKAPARRRNARRARQARTGTGTGSGAASGRAIVARPSPAEQQLDARRFVDQTQTHIARRWMEGFYPIYGTAQRTFGVNWLLIASIHRQESAFSTAPDTYTGLNFAGCCGGPMQFNVTNRPVTTWQLVSDSYRYGVRPVRYDHATATHPSIYDDFDSVMAAGRLLSANGATYALDAGAWDAAYAYYGHDPTGVTYADQVLARAIGWSQHGFCINCGVEQGLIDAAHAAYGAPVLAALVMASAARVAR